MRTRQWHVAFVLRRHPPPQDTQTLTDGEAPRRILERNDLFTRSELGDIRVLLELQVGITLVGERQT